MEEPKVKLDSLLNADLHCHSCCSDGTLAPAELAELAKKNGVELWALTDHDDLSGTQEAALSAKKLGLPFLAGVEVSTCFGQESIHVVGLGVDIENDALQNGLRKIREGRGERAHKIAQALQRLGVEDALGGALSFAKNSQLISRAHFSRFLVSQGICKDNADAFNRYLRQGKPAYVHHEWLSLEECLSLIHEAQGVAVLAHPGRYQGMSKNQRKKLLSAFSALGGQGVEVVTSAHSAEEAILYKKMAQDHGLMGSRGSDFHSLEESRIHLGELPLLSPDIDPIWSVLEDRIVYE